MAFSRKRGRPKKISPQGQDKGTFELIEKRKAFITSEPLDLCASRGLITEQQQNAGIRLRWLYTLKFGAPTLSSYTPDGLGGLSCRHEDIDWIQRRQHEYARIIQHLDKTRSRQIVMDICVFSRMPGFLYKIPANLNSNNLMDYIKYNQELSLFVDGLDGVCTLINNRPKIINSA